jgi:uncharacterized RDD family membrane protein YckC
MNYPLATRKRRMAAYFLDCIFSGILIGMPIGFIYAAVKDILGWPDLEIIDLLLPMPFVLLYFSADGGPRQATWGKRIFGLKVERLDQTHLGRFKAMLRYLGWCCLDGIVPLAIAFAIFFMPYIIPSVNVMVAIIAAGIALILAHISYFTVFYYKQSGQFLHDRIFSTRVIYVKKFVEEIVAGETNA